MYTYVPAIRHGINEEKALKNLNQTLQGKSADELSPDRVKPLVEIVEDDDFNALENYTEHFDEVFVDYPRYLEDRDNKHKSEVSDLISKYSDDPVEFFTRNKRDDYTPVVSGRLSPIDLSDIHKSVVDLKEEFDRIAVRIFVPTDEYSPIEKDEIKKIIEECRTDDVVILDAPDVAELSRAIRPNIDFVRSLLSGQESYVFDLFEPRGEVNYNYGLVMGKHADVDGVGDFVVEPRFPQDIPDAAFQNIPKRIRQYEDDIHSVDTWEDSDSYVEAVENMISNGALDPSHCPFCEELESEYRKVKSKSSRKDLGGGFVKRMRMDHYSYSVLQDEFPEMDSASSAKDFDSEGYSDIS